LTWNIPEMIRGARWTNLCDPRHSLAGVRAVPSRVV